MIAHRPTFDELQRDPELGVLAILDTALAMARFQLIALEPDLWLEPTTRRPAGAERLRRLVADIDALAESIRAYVAPPPRHGVCAGDYSFDIPF